MSIEFGPNAVEKARKQIGAGKAFEKPNSTSMGAGAANDAAAALIDAIQCPAGQMPTLWQVRAHWQGPLLDSTVSQVFQPQTDILSLGKNIQQSQTAVTQGLTNGELQTPSLICGVFVHVSTSPIRYTLPGASWTKPAAASNAPVVPDTWTSEDVVSVSGGAAGSVDTALGIATGQTFTRASMNFGGWAQGGLWAMCRAFNFVWSYGDKTTLLDWPLRFMAWLPPNAQNGTAGAGPVETVTAIAGMNNYYSANGSSTVFLPRNARRTGSVTIGGHVVSKFSPDDSFRQVVPFIGGETLREGLERNTEVFMLPRPVLYPRGVSLGMYLNTKDATSFSEMQSAFSITNGLGLAQPAVPAVPPIYVPAANINPGYGAGANSGVTPTFAEQTSDVPPANNFLQVRSDEAIFKWGDLFISIGSIGYELTQSQYDQINNNQGAISGILQSNGCPCHFL